MATTEHQPVQPGSEYPPDVPASGSSAQRPVPGAAPTAVTPPPPSDAIGDPGALGLAGFAATTFVLSAFNTNLLHSSVSAVVLPLALFYGGLAQLLAGLWEYRKGNTFGATAFCSYGAFWLSYAAYVKFVVPGLPAADAYQATAMYLLAWAIFTAYMTPAALRVNGAVFAVFVTLTATFVVLVIGNFGQYPNVVKAGGWVGLATALCAWYASFALVTNGTWKRTVIPVFPHVADHLPFGHRGAAGVRA